MFSKQRKLLIGNLKTRLSQPSFYWKTLFVLGVTVIFFLNAFHESYPDEFDNIAGGWFILHGRLIYTGFFTHHGPVPYYLAALLELFSGRSFVKFRIIYEIFLAIINFLFYLFLKRRLGKPQTNFYLFFIAFLALEATYYWTHMLLADNTAAFCFMMIYALILLKTIYKKSLDLTDITFVSVVGALGFYSSLTYAYLYIIVIIYSLSYYYLQFGKKNFTNILSLKFFQPVIIVIIPHALFLAYLLITQSLSDYIFQNFTFNARYYIYNYPRPAGSTSVNPIRYAVVIAHNFLVSFFTLIIGVKEFNFAFPVNMTLAVGNVATIIYLMLKKNFRIAALLGLVLIYSNVRSDPLTSKETDYQSAVYILISFFNIAFLLPKLYEDLNNDTQLSRKIVSGFLMLIVGLYSFFTLFYLILRFDNKYYPKYMGGVALIYDRPQIAPIINTVAGPNDYVWIGPFEFEELFYTNGKLPSKYHILIPGMGKSTKVKQEILSDFTTNPPKVIYFDPNFFILGTQTKLYSQFFLDFLDQNYITLLNYTDGNVAYRSVAPISIQNKVDIETKLFIRKDQIANVTKALLAANYIKQITITPKPSKK